jgi:hypothetical protein
MSNWYADSAQNSLSSLDFGDVRAFHDAALRSFIAMQRSQACVEVLLPQRYFGPMWAPQAKREPRDQVWCCKVADNTPPRLVCEDRELVLRVVDDFLIGVDPLKHGGLWLSRALLYSFLAGGAEEVPHPKYRCRRPLGFECSGTKAADGHRPKEAKGVRKKRDPRDYPRWDEEAHND